MTWPDRGCAGSALNGNQASLHLGYDFVFHWTQNNPTGPRHDSTLTKIHPGFGIKDGRGWETKVPADFPPGERLRVGRGICLPPSGLRNTSSNRKLGRIGPGVMYSLIFFVLHSSALKAFSFICYSWERSPPSSLHLLRSQPCTSFFSHPLAYAYFLRISKWASYDVQSNSRLHNIRESTR